MIPTRWSTLALVGTLPLVAALAACGSDSATLPVTAAPAVDTIVADFNTLTVAQRDSEYQASDTVVRFGLYSYGADQYAGWYTNGGGTPVVQEYRPLISFDLPTLAGTAVVDSAKAYAFQCGSYGYDGGSGLDAFAVGHVEIDHVSFGAVVTNMVAAFDGPGLQQNIGTISSDSTRGFKGMTVTADVQADYTAKRSWSQYRMRYVRTTPPTPGYSYIYVDFGSDCGNQGGPGPFMVVWSH